MCDSFAEIKLVKGHLYIVSGPSTCGKTTLVNSLNAEPLKSILNVELAPKFSTRKERIEPGVEDDVTQLFDSEGIPQIRLGAIDHYDQCGYPVDLGDGLDVAYLINKNTYAVSSSLIKKQIDADKNVFIVASDFRVIRALKSIFGARASTLYIAAAVTKESLEKTQAKRGLDLPEQAKTVLSKRIRKLKAASHLNRWQRIADELIELVNYWNKNKPGGESTEARAERISTFHARYIDNMTLFDHVILNFNEGKPEQMTLQVKNLINTVTPREKVDWNQIGAPIFIIAASSGAGKGTLMDVLHLMGRERITITSKIAGRNKKDNDKNDGMVAIGTPDHPPREWPEWPEWWTSGMIQTAKSGKFPDQYNLRWGFHGVVTKEGLKQTQYAVSTEEIERNIENGVPQIFVSNMGEYQNFRRLYGRRAVFLYLYRLNTMEEIERWHYEIYSDEDERAAKTSEVTSVLHDYFDKIAEIDHVLLNTTREEDLFDQIFQLIDEYYSNYTNTI